MAHSTTAGLMLGQRLRRCPNINPALVEWPMFGEYKCFIILKKRQAQITLIPCELLQGRTMDLTAHHRGQPRTSAG